MSLHCLSAICYDIKIHAIPVSFTIYKVTQYIIFGPQMRLSDEKKK